MLLHTRLLFCTVRVEELLDGIKERIPTFQGVKFSDTDLLDLAQCINKTEREQFAFLYGVDEVRGSSELFLPWNSFDTALGKKVTLDIQCQLILLLPLIPSPTSTRPPLFFSLFCYVK